MEDSTPPDADGLTDGWPQDPDNDGLARFAREFDAGRPELPEPSLDRIRQTVRSEIGRVVRRRRVQRIAAIVGTAASVLLAVGLYVWSFRGGPPPGERAELPNGVDSPAAVPMVEHEYPVTLTVAAPGDSPGPLLPMDKYGSLIDEAR